MKHINKLATHIETLASVWPTWIAFNDIVIDEEKDIKERAEAAKSAEYYIKIRYDRIKNINEEFEKLIK